MNLSVPHDSQEVMQCCHPHRDLRQNGKIFSESMKQFDTVLKFASYYHALTFSALLLILIKA